MLLHDFNFLKPPLSLINYRKLKNFIDILILAKLRNAEPMSGYDVISFPHQKFYILISPGTIYSVLYRLEREELVEGMSERNKTIYKLTDKGEKTINALLCDYEKIQNLLSAIFVDHQLPKRSSSCISST